MTETLAKEPFDFDALFKRIEEEVNPVQYVIKLQGKPYLPGPARIHWFQCFNRATGFRFQTTSGVDDNTDKYTVDSVKSKDEKISRRTGFITIATTICLDGVPLVTGRAEIEVSSFGKAKEKVETQSFARAVSFLGFGTLGIESLEEDDFAAMGAPQIAATSRRSKTWRNSKHESINNTNTSTANSIAAKCANTKYRNGANRTSDFNNRNLPTTKESSSAGSGNSWFTQQFFTATNCDTAAIRCTDHPNRKQIGKLCLY